MSFDPSTFWWIAAGAAVAAELLTGTFYLLMIALGLVGGAVAAHLGASTMLQWLTAAAIGGGATAVWHFARGRAPVVQPERDVNVNLDIGERVHVRAWNPDGSARVDYRGTQWTARLQPGAPRRDGAHAVVAVEGNWLVLAPASDS